MAGQIGTPRDPLDPAERIAAEPHRFGLFQALRLIEAERSDKARLGRVGTRAADEPIRLAQEPSMEFPPTMIAGVDSATDKRPAVLRVFGLGLFGVNGPLPIHLTDHVLERRTRHGDNVFARFADIFHHRALSLFYRAWADSEPTVGHDRPNDDPFAGFIASLVGLGEPSLRDRDALPDGVKLHFSGRLIGQTRDPGGLKAMITTFFEIPAEIREFVVSWMELPSEIRWRLGDRSGVTLGEGPTIGARVRDAQHRFRIELGPMGLADYERMLPGGAGFARLTAMVRGYVGDEFAWESRLILRAEEVPPFRLGASTRLGWTSWLARRPEGRDADDLILDPTSIRPAVAADQAIFLNEPNGGLDPAPAAPGA